jgi:hypothetical protein
MTIYIRNVQSPPANRQNGQCIYLADPTAEFLAEGTLDVDVRDSYQATLLVGSQMLARGDSLNTRAESNRVHLNGAVVDITNPDGSDINSFTSTGTGFVDPQTANASSFGLLAVTVIDAATSAKIGGQLSANGTPKLVLANIKAFGKTLGGVDVETGQFQFPIRVCKGCLITFALGDDPATPGRDCNLPLSSSTATAGSTSTSIPVPCNLGQDEVVDCRLCVSNRTPDPCKGQ